MVLAVVVVTHSLDVIVQMCNVLWYLLCCLLSRLHCHNSGRPVEFAGLMNDCRCIMIAMTASQDW